MKGHHRGVIALAVRGACALPGGREGRGTGLRDGGIVPRHPGRRWEPLGPVTIPGKPVRVA